MALHITNERVIPENAVPLTRGEAINYQWRQITEWPELSDVWPFKLGLTGMGALAMGSALYINKHYRRKLKLRHQGFLATILPMSVAPPMIGSVLHVQKITADLFLNDTKCSLCLQYRAIAIQLGCSILYPIVLAPISNFMVATHYCTYRLPYWNEFRKTLNLWLQFTRPLGKSLALMMAVQVLAAGFVTYAEAESLRKVKSKLLEEQERWEIEKKSFIQRIE